MNKIKEVIKIMRINHYIKNFIIFLPIIFSGNFFNKEKAISTIIGFIIFSLTCSVIYIINDLKDKNKDKLHYKKKFRPLAKNSITTKEAILLIIFLIIITSTIIYIVKINNLSLLLIIIYIVLNLLYTFKLKKIPIIDIFILSLLFVIRVLYGASLINVIVSNWLYLTIMSSSFYLALSKRKMELENEKNTRDVLKYYTNNYLEKNMYMFLSMAIIFYSLWTIDLKSVYKSSNYLILTVPFIMTIAMKYNLNIETTKEDNPVEIILKDKILIILILIYVLVIISILYLL